MRYRRGASTLGPARTTPGGWIAVAACMLLLVLGGCASASAGSTSATTPLASATGHQSTATSTLQSTAPAGPAYVQITDLNTFRQQLSAAFSKNTWSAVVPYLSPEFSFQGLDSGGNRMEMPDSETDLSHLYATQGPWSPAALYEVQIHFCDAGATPINQQIGFDGGGGSFILFGIDLWQGVWLVYWGFQDPNGGGDACASS